MTPDCAPAPDFVPLGPSKQEIVIRCLPIESLIGVDEHERKSPRHLLLDLTLELRPQAVIADHLDEVLDYNALVVCIRTASSEARFYLLESLATHLAALCFAFPRVCGCRVTLTKPGLFTPGSDVGVCLTFRQP